MDPCRKRQWLYFNPFHGFICFTWYPLNYKKEDTTHPFSAHRIASQEILNKREICEYDARFECVWDQTASRGRIPKSSGIVPAWPFEKKSKRKKHSPPPPRTQHKCIDQTFFLIHFFFLHYYATKMHTNATQTKRGMRCNLEPNGFIWSFGWPTYPPPKKKDSSIPRSCRYRKISKSRAKEMKKSSMLHLHSCTTIPGRDCSLWQLKAPPCPAQEIKRPPSAAHPDGGGMLSL